jgi:hypothetical protein
MANNNTQEIRVYTKNKNPKICRDELKFAAKFMYSMLVSTRIHNKTTLLIESKPIESKQKLDGFIYVLDDDIPTYRPKTFQIVLNTNPGKRQQLMALAHELVHCKQYTKGELGNTFTRKDMTLTKWKKQFTNETKVHYFDLPWEIDANGREYGLYRRYKNFVKEHNIKFKPDKKRS